MSDRRPDRRQLPPHHRSHRRRRRRPGLPAGRPRLRLLLEPPDQVASLNQAAGPHLLRARRVRARARAQPAHHGRRRRRHHADLRSTRATTATRWCGPTATSCSRAGSTWPTQPLRRSSAPSPTAPTCSCSTARTARATASCTRATWTRTGKYKGFVSSVADAAVGHAGGRRADVHRRGQLLRAQHAGQPQRAGARRPERGRPSKPLNMGRGLSLFGRVTTPYPLWDGTNRVLVAYRPCEVTRNGVVVPCATLTRRRDRAPERRRPHDAEAVAADAVQDNAPAAYAIYMFDPGQQTWLIVAAPPPGFMYTDPVALQPRARAQRDRRRPRRRRAGGAGPGADRGAQRLRHRRPGPHGRRRCSPPPTCRPAAARGIAKTAPADAARHPRRRWPTWRA